ncbi:hypothetical protein C427_2786 [Paraglaciecola psychrophila 170]|uniref:Uncharacterized protein n=1 Tax=Paraglaciecola psychrophila 170 TaxID=1129794 RepID=K7A1I1_9ALTE|nr:hypothetical protein C427_2786 [Paraglaciecola psychrophila 170]GAC36252.1 hypothetical protein GPSY_0614 [Paraglaciecola psychrophila 170]
MSKDNKGKPLYLSPHVKKLASFIRTTNNVKVNNLARS